MYDQRTVEQRCAALATHLLPCLKGGILYAMKANPHVDLLRAVLAAGGPRFGLECVSVEEVRRARAVSPTVHVQFTPNFAPISEYADAFAVGAAVVIDNVEIVRAHPDIFQGKSVGLRIDPHAHASEAHGHHSHVRTSGGKQKFGLPIAQARAACLELRRQGVRVVGIHAHVGSGVVVPGMWRETALAMCGLLLKRRGEVDGEKGEEQRGRGCDGETVSGGAWVLGEDRPALERRDAFSDVAWIDIGGGLGIGLDLAAVAASLAPLARALSAEGDGDGEGRLSPPLSIKMEPGRYIVAEAGVMLTPVTQIRRKAGRTFVGAATGMNSLIRPALYQAEHGIHNLSRLDEAQNDDAAGAVATMVCDVVGPICESADVLGHQRTLPSSTAPGDILLVEHGGAYGHCMSSHYNLRAPATEVVLRRRR